MNLPFGVVLASASPRRHQLLKELIANFDVCPVDIDETPGPNEAPLETALRLARQKANEGYRIRPDCLVVSGDTVVTNPDDPLGQFGKPVDDDAAIAMLRALSGRSHQVITAIGMEWPEGEHSFYDSTTVWFRELSDREIEAYVATGEPMDKAGAYAIQGGAAGFVERIEGSLENVIGLPVRALRLALYEHFTAD